ncbi:MULTISPECIES: malic enzyme-like NAD(P)-binding protein [unclassified Oceanispirochaeta]|uniref:malic enzyme-like NAD(P)-binding protein n=1 Tax=unclassified Oceanispirochaeta TaxID=2635722 RepID=UPI000E099706|nr:MULTISPECIES: malic enzyme-like NAD(P)-binding protein [unclassified Oceanispirochaeta]MBF9017856.1 malate dehydrogenase [Oceanispirochaeta sp. M2]NPD74367.1 malate dehydrogenase [Oceanispirochaeta sp. M1]RDG29754.1 malate dehydrogenase [Oceanispirochaeta sp. M1]
MDDMKKRALEYHTRGGQPGKLEVIASKPCATADDLTLAYSPGVAHPVLEIAANPKDAYKYTGKGNLVGVITNGTAILGLGDKGALASKPVMEGKGVLFKRFADIDVFDIELDCKDPKKIIEAVKMMQPTFGGINLEDIGAPECFEIEQTLIKECDIPIFHDDQHGTAIIATAGMMNAAEITGKKMGELKVVVNGAGAAGISCSRMFLAAGVKRENLLLLDSKGVLYKGRTERVTPEKVEFLADTEKRSLAEAVDGADVFIGLSVADCLTADMLKTMANDPVIFAMANPNPEIRPELALATRDDIIIGTGRSDYPNQVNNVLGFPFIFRGAMDVKSKMISEGMKMAAAKALAALAKEPVPQEVRDAYGRDFVFGKEYVVPKPFDPRVIEWEAVAVAKAACDEGLAAEPITDWEAYKASLRARMEKHWK